MIYTIKQGRHNSNLFIPQRLWVGYGVYHIGFSFQFLNDTEYSLPAGDMEDINKLFGLSFGSHHNNSFRIGWTSIGDKVALHAYYYNHGERKSKFIYLINRDTEVVGNINIDRDNDTITLALFVNGNVIKEVYSFDFEGVSMWSYRLFPYFGGNNPAPKRFIIDLNVIYNCRFVI